MSTVCTLFGACSPSINNQSILLRPVTLRCSCYLAPAIIRLRAACFQRRFKTVFHRSLLNKAAANGAHVAVIDVEGVALSAGTGRVNEPPRMICPASSCRHTVRVCSPARPRRLPGDSAASGDAGFFNHAIAIHQGGDQRRSNSSGLMGRPPRITPALRRYQKWCRTLYAGAGFPDRCVAAGVDQLQRRDHIVRGVVTSNSVQFGPRSGFASTKASSLQCAAR